VLMVYDSDPYATKKHLLYMLKVGGQKVIFDPPPLEKVGVS